MQPTVYCTSHAPTTLSSQKATFKKLKAKHSFLKVQNSGPYTKIELPEKFMVPVQITKSARDPPHYPRWETPEPKQPKKLRPLFRQKAPPSVPHRRLRVDESPTTILPSPAHASCKELPLIRREENLT